MEEVLNVSPERAGVVRLGEVPKTRSPLPVSSEITPASWADVVVANTPRLLAVSATVPVDAGNVIVFVPAVAVACRAIVPDVEPERVRVLPAGSVVLLLRVIVLATVALPMAIALALAFVPILMPPVVPESIEIALVVADDRVRVPDEDTVPASMDPAE